MSRRELVKNLTVFVVAVIFSVITVEIALHFIFPSSSMYIEGGNSVYRLKPGYNKFNRNINSLGFRNSEFTVRKEAGKRRILFIGDSFTFGATSSEHSFPGQFEALVNEGYPDYEVINGGVPAYSTVHEYYFLKDYCRELDADIVVLALYVGNDIEENAVFDDVEREGSYLISTRMRSPERKIQKFIAFVNKSKIVSLIRNSFFSYERLVDRNTEQLVNNVINRYLKWYGNNIVDNYALHYNFTGFYFSLQGRKCSAYNSQKLEETIRLWSDGVLPDNDFRSYLWHFLTEGLSGQKRSERGYSRAVYLALQLKHTEIYYTDSLKEGWNGTAGVLKKIKDLCLERKQKLVVVVIPDETQLQLWLQQEVLRYNLDRVDKPDFDLPQKRLAEILKELNIDFIDILPIFRKRTDSLYLKYNSHCNRIGNMIIAEEVYNFLEEKYFMKEKMLK